MKSFYLILFSIPSFICNAQKVSTSEPVKLGVAINSSAEETNPILANDGKILYFVRALHNKNQGGEFAGSDIWKATLGTGGKILTVTNELGKWNNVDNNAVVGIRDDDQVIYLLNSYNKTSGIAFSKKINNNWTNPEVINIPGLNKSGSVGFYMGSDYSYLLISMSENDGANEDLFICLKDSTNKWSKPINLGSTINTPGFEISPFLSADKRLLFFASNGHGGYGDADIFVSERLYDGWTVWSDPVNLGPKVNSSNFDAFFTMSNSGHSYYVSNKNSESGFSDIFFLDRVQVERLADQERVYLSDKETEDIIGKKFVEIIFEPNSAELSGEWKELLWFVSQKASEYESLKISLIGRAKQTEEMADSNLALQRTLNVHSFLRFAELSDDQISIDNHLSYVPKSSENEDKISGVKLKFYYE